MNSFTFKSIVVVFIFLSTSESKDFCEAFKDNGFQIDYSFQMHYLGEDDTLSYQNLFVIGFDYWMLQTNQFDGIQLSLNEGSTNKQLGGHYSLAFSLHNQTNISNPFIIYGFFRKNDSMIEWKQFNVSQTSNGLTLILHKLYGTNKTDFVPGFVPSVSKFNKVSETGAQFWFISQKQNKNRFNRKYINGYYSQISAGHIPLFTSKNLFKSYDNVKHNMIAAFGPKTTQNNIKYSIFFVRNKSIVYCYQNIPNPDEHGDKFRESYIGEECSPKEMVFINCTQSATKEPTVSTISTTTKSPQKTNYLPAIILGVIFGIVTILALLAFLFTYMHERAGGPSNLSRPNYAKGNETVNTSKVK